MSEFVKEINDSEFDSLVAEGVVFVDFWAPWCGPCQMMAPILDEVAQAVGDSATITKMNVDDNSATPSKFGVQSIPTMIVFKNGEEVDRLIGVSSKEEIIAKLDAVK